MQLDIYFLKIKMTPAPEQYQGLEVIEPRAQLIAPHNGGKLTFLHPSYGPNTYANVGLAIQQDNLRRPTMAETASLVHAAFYSDDTYSTKIRGIMRQGCLLGFTVTLHVSNKEAFIQDDPEIRDGMPFMDLDDLVQKLSAKDPSVRHVQFGYKVGEMSPLELSKNVYVIALAGEEGAEKLARVAGEYSGKPYLWSFKSVDGNVTRVSTLTSRALVHRLGVGGGRRGRAFGVLK